MKRFLMSMFSTVFLGASLAFSAILVADEFQIIPIGSAVAIAWECNHLQNGNGHSCLNSIVGCPGQTSCGWTLYHAGTPGEYWLCHCK